MTEKNRLFVPWFKVKALLSLATQLRLCLMAQIIRASKEKGPYIPLKKLLYAYIKIWHN